MKTLKSLLVLAFLGGLFVSCTPESIDNGQDEQQIDLTDVRVPRQG